MDPEAVTNLLIVASWVLREIAGLVSRHRRKAKERRAAIGETSWPPPESKR